MTGISTLTLGDRTKILFLVRAKTFLSWAPKTHVVANGKIVPKPRNHLQKVSLSFNKTSVSVVCALYGHGYVLEILHSLLLM